jgi:hypothetical protein
MYLYQRRYHDLPCYIQSLTLQEGSNDVRKKWGLKLNTRKTVIKANEFEYLSLWVYPRLSRKGIYEKSKQYVITINLYVIHSYALMTSNWGG